ncbi:hypothetical protein VTL71DRAFT_11306 [Oculimacula yallundae]|uniref:Zn(2)-C6 fungal-type domain-containing protein n=1 Tax=Oculimacula yallundae TaxID=86028 RepID=A0ABR4CRG1_9HELO
MLALVKQLLRDLCFLFLPICTPELVVYTGEGEKQTHRNYLQHPVFISPGTREEQATLMSEANDNSDQDSGGESRRKRTRQACVNCRRKKVRCSGEKPICNFCSRLSQPCIYTIDGRTHRASSMALYAVPNDYQPMLVVQAPPFALQSVFKLISGGQGLIIWSQDALATKFAALEDRVSRLQQIVDRLEPLATPVILPSIETIDSTVPQHPQVTTTAETFVTHQDQSVEGSHRTELPRLQDLLFAADVYFRFCHNQPYSLFHEEDFRRRLTNNDLPIYLVWAFLSAARRYCKLLNTQTDSDDDSSACAGRAWKCIDLPWNVSTSQEEALHVCQAIVLIVGSENPAGLCSQAYMKLGFAIRLALECKLNIEPDTSLPVNVREERKRTFWSLYLQDKLISLTRGRFCMIRDEECKISLPSSEESFQKHLPESTPTLQDLTGDCIEQDAVDICCPLALIPVIAATLGRVSHYVLQETRDRLVLPPWSSTAPFSALSSALMQAEHYFGLNEDPALGLTQRCMVNGTIDQHLAGSFIFSKALFHLSHCLLHHPFLIQQRLQALKQEMPPSFTRLAWQKCRAHAISITSLRDMRNHNVLILTSLYGYCTMVAGTIHALSINDDRESVREDGRKHYCIALESLRDLSCYWGHAALMVKRLERFHSLCESHDSKLTPSSANTDRSPGETKALWQSVDYSSLATPTRPASPIGIADNIMENLWPSSIDFLDFTNFESFGEGLDTLGSVNGLDGYLMLDTSSHNTFSDT